MRRAANAKPIQRARGKRGGFKRKGTISLKRFQPNYSLPKDLCPSVSDLWPLGNVRRTMSATADWR